MLNGIYSRSILSVPVQTIFFSIAQWVELSYNNIIRQWGMEVREIWKNRRNQ